MVQGPTLLLICDRASFSPFTTSFDWARSVASNGRLVTILTLFVPPPLLLELVPELLLPLEPQAPSAETATRQPAAASQRDAKGFPSSRKAGKGAGTLTRRSGRCQAVNRLSTCFPEWRSQLGLEVRPARLHP